MGDGGGRPSALGAPAEPAGADPGQPQAPGGSEAGAGWGPPRPPARAGPGCPGAAGPRPGQADDLARLRATVRDEYEARSAGSDVAVLQQRQVALERRIRDRTRTARIDQKSGRSLRPVPRADLVPALGAAALIEFLTLDG